MESITETTPRSRSGSVGDSPPHVTLRRQKSLQVPSLEKIALALMKLVLQHDKTTLIKDAKFEQLRNRTLFELYLSSMGRTPSTLGAAMCAALMEEDITKRFDEIANRIKVDNIAHTRRPMGEVKNSTEDFFLFHTARELLIKRKLILRFLMSPTAMSEKLEDDSKDMHDAALLEESQPEFKYLLACRLEALGKVNLAVDIYAHLLKTRFCFSTQIANLIRIGTQSPTAHYTLAKLILEKTEIPENFTQPLKDFAWISYQFASNKESENRQKILAAQPPKSPSLYEAALCCLHLAVFAADIPNTNAVKFLANTYQQGIEGFVQQSIKKACQILYYGYTKIQDEPTRERLLDKITQMHRTSPQNIWANFILGNYHLTRSRKFQGKVEVKDNSPRLNDQLQAAYDRYRVCTKNLTNNDELYMQDNFEIITLLGKKLFEMAEIYSDRVAISAQEIKHAIVETAVKLYKHASYLGNYDATRRLAERNRTLKADKPDDQARLDEETDKYYVRALEAALANLSKQDFRALLEDYHKFLRETGTDYQRFTGFLAREKELLINLDAIELFSHYHSNVGVFSFSAKAENSATLDKIRLLDQSPLACALLWSTAEVRKKSEHSKKLLDILNSKGFLDRTSPIFIDIVITKLIDYFNLARHHSCALNFFPCLREALSNRIKATDQQNLAELTTLRELNTLTEFIHGILENDSALMQAAKNISAINCKHIFDNLASRILLTIDQYHFAKSIFEIPKPLLPSISSPAVQITPQNVLRKNSASDTGSTSPETKKLIHEWAKLPTEQRDHVKRQLKFALETGNSPVDSNDEEATHNNHEHMSISAPADDRRSQGFFEAHTQRQRKKHSGERGDSLSQPAQATTNKRSSLPVVTDLPEFDPANRLK